MAIRCGACHRSRKRSTRTSPCSATRRSRGRSRCSAARCSTRRSPGSRWNAVVTCASASRTTRPDRPNVEQVAGATALASDRRSTGRDDRRGRVDPGPPRMTTTPKTRTRRSCSRFLDALSAGDVAGAAACFDADRYYSHAWEGDLAVTWEKMKTRRRGDTFVDWQTETVALVGDGDRVVHHSHSRFTDAKTGRARRSSTISRSGGSTTASSSNTGAACASTSECRNSSTEPLRYLRMVMPNRGDQVVITNRKARYDYSRARELRVRDRAARRRGEVDPRGAREPPGRLRPRRRRRGVAARPARLAVLVLTRRRPRSRPQAQAAAPQSRDRADHARDRR